MDFKDKIIDWYRICHRELPWRNTTDPYKIWLSEIILQQTRVKQGLPYYLKFSEAFPTIIDFANASEDYVLKLWEGLGYYSRARNMHKTANHIVDKLGAEFPKSYADLIKLKGIGDYTASAISSFSANEVHAVVDGNVFRVLSRIYGISTPIDSSLGKKEFKNLASELICSNNPGLFNQSIMEFGAIQCTPKNPKCESCPFEDSCIAFAKNQTDELPIKKNAIKQRTRYFEYLILINENQTIIKKRTEKDIWQNLFDFPLIENPSPKSEEQIIEQLNQIITTSFKVASVTAPIKHILSHQKLWVRFWKLMVTDLVIFKNNDLIVSFKDLDEYAFPKVVDNYLSIHELE